MSTLREIEILVVDDDRELSETLKDFLVGEGYSVATADSAAAATEFYEHHPQTALVVLDLMMPHTDGISAMEALHRQNPDLPVVIMTGFATIETAVDASGAAATTPSTGGGARPRASRRTTFSCSERQAGWLAHRNSGWSDRTCCTAWRTATTSSAT